MSSQRVTTVLTYGILSLAGIISFTLPKALVPGSAGMALDPPDVLNLSGIIHDFASTHPDFDITDPAVMGHYVGNVGPMLGGNGQPVFADSGQHYQRSDFSQHSASTLRDPGIAARTASAMNS